MTKLEYFLASLKAKAYRRYTWVYGALSVTKMLTKEEVDDKIQRSEYKDLDIVRFDRGCYMFRAGKFEPIECPLDQPYLLLAETINLPAGVIDNFPDGGKTTYANALFNKFILADTVGAHYPYVNSKKQANIVAIENALVKNLVREVTKPGEISTLAYLEFQKNCLAFQGWNTLCVAGLTEKTVTPPPGRDEFRAKLIEKHKGSLKSPETVAAIDKAMLEFAYETHLKGDPGMAVLTGKQFHTAYKKMYLTHGAEVGMEANVDVTFIPTSLSEGWDLKSLPAYNNSLRIGSFYRGAQTQKGGEATKKIAMATVNMRIEGEDCGTKVGLPLNIDKNTKHFIEGMYVISNGESVLVEDSSSYLGKVVNLRVPGVCLTDTICKKCAGTKLAMNPNGLAMANLDEGSNFLAMFLASAHAKQMVTERLDIFAAVD